VARIGEMRNTTFWSESLKGRYHSEDLSVYGREIRWEGVDWIYLAQDGTGGRFL
jgi:hypothetical protein